MNDAGSLGPSIVAALDAGDLDGALGLIDTAAAAATPSERSMYLHLRGRLLLAIGDRYEKEIAANREVDARYR